MKARNTIQHLIAVAATASILSGCEFMKLQQGMEAAQAPTVSNDSGVKGPTAPTGGKEISVGDAKGVVASPSFDTFAVSIADALGVASMGTTANANYRTVRDALVADNLPDTGAPEELTLAGVFAYTKVAIAVCTDMVGGTSMLKSDLTMNAAISSTQNTDAKWGAYFDKLGERLWARETGGIVMAERNALLALKNDLAAKTGLTTTQAAIAVCASMAVAPDSLVR